VPAQLQQVGAARARFVLVERLDQEIGRAAFERVVADLAIVDHVMTTIGMSTQWAGRGSA
jgi:hypothetical protein